MPGPNLLRHHLQRLTPHLRVCISGGEGTARTLRTKALEPDAVAQKRVRRRARPSLGSTTPSAGWEQSSQSRSQKAVWGTEGGKRTPRVAPDAQEVLHEHRCPGAILLVSGVLTEMTAPGGHCRSVHSARLPTGQPQKPGLTRERTDQNMIPEGKCCLISLILLDLLLFPLPLE